MKDSYSNYWNKKSTTKPNEYKKYLSNSIKKKHMQNGANSDIIKGSSLYFLLLNH